MFCWGVLELSTLDTRLFFSNCRDPCLDGDQASNERQRSTR
jgi:hypothetical protein